MGLPVVRQYDAEIRTRIFNFAAKLAAGEVLIAPLSVSTSDPALVASILGHDDLSVTCRLSGGVAGSRYTVTIRSATSYGNLLELDTAVEIFA